MYIFNQTKLVSFFVLFLYLFYTPFIASESLILADTFLIFLFLLSIYLILKGENNNYNFILTLAVLSLSQVKEFMIYLIPIYLLLFVITKKI